MFGFTYNLTDINTITIIRADEFTPVEWTFTNLLEVKKQFENQGFKVETKFNNI